MQLTRESSTQHLIRAWEPGRIRIAERWIAGHVIVSAEQIVEGWMEEKHPGWLAARKAVLRDER